MRTIPHMILQCLFCTYLFGQSAPLTSPQQEQISIQSNHELYIVGESVFLSISCEVGEQASEQSKIIYVEILDANNTSRIRKRYALRNGKFTGSLFLPSNLKTDNYAIVAYTQWSRNFSRAYFGSKVISIINPFEQLREGLFTRQSLAESEIITGNFPFELTLDKRAYAPKEQVKLLLELNETIEVDEVIVSVEKETIRDRVKPKELQLIDRSSQQNSIAFDFPPEKRGHLLSGIVVQDDQQPASVVLSLSNETMNKIQFAQSNEKGFFSFPVNLNFSKDPLILKASENVSFTILDQFIEDHQWNIPELTVDTLLTEWILERAREVQIEDDYFNEKFEISVNRDSLGFLDYLPSKTYYLDEYTRFPKIEDPILEYIPEIKMRTKRGTKLFSIANLPFSANDSTLILFNGVPLNSKSLFNQNPNYVESIAVYSSNVSINGFEFAGIIHFKTFSKYLRNVRFYNSQKVSLAEITYIDKETPDNLPDFRNQLLWQSVPIKDRSPVQLEFLTPLSKGNYNIKIIDNDNRVLGTKRFRVW